MGKPMNDLKFSYEILKRNFHENNTIKIVKIKYRNYLTSKFLENSNFCCLNFFRQYEIKDNISPPPFLHFVSIDIKANHCTVKAIFAQYLFLWGVIFLLYCV